VVRTMALHRPHLDVGEVVVGVAAADPRHRRPKAKPKLHFRAPCIPLATFRPGVGGLPGAPSNGPDTHTPAAPRTMSTTVATALLRYPCTVASGARTCRWVGWRAYALCTAAARLRPLLPHSLASNLTTLLAGNAHCGQPNVGPTLELGRCLTARQSRTRLRKGGVPSPCAIPFQGVIGTRAGVP